MLLCCIAAVLSVTPSRASVVDIPATITRYAEYDTYSNTYYKVYGDLQYGQFTHHYTRASRAFLKFSLDSLPDTCALTSAELTCYQYASVESPPSVNIRLAPDPVPRSAAEIYSQMDSATTLV